MGAAKSRRPSADWSRGVQLAQKSVGTPGFALNSAENTLHLIWLSETNDDYTMHHRAVEQSSFVREDRVLRTVDGSMRAPQIRPIADGLFNLFWLERPVSTSGWVLMAAQMSGSGDFLTEPAVLTSDELNVGGYVVSQTARGDAAIVLEERRATALLGAIFPKNGEATAFTLIAEEATLPAAQLDEAGTLHVSWLSGETMRYAALSADRLAPTAGTAISDLDISQSSQLQSPGLAVADDYVYSVWSVFQRSGLEAGTGFTEYVSFERGNPQKSEVQRIWVSPAEKPVEVGYTGGYALENFSEKPSSASRVADYVLSPRVGAPIGNSVAVAVDVRQQLRLNDEVQPAIALFEDGEYIGYQFAGKSDGLSRGLALINEAGGLHLLWREGAAGRNIFYATTGGAYTWGAQSCATG